MALCLQQHPLHWLKTPVFFLLFRNLKWFIIPANSVAHQLVLFCHNTITLAVSIISRLWAVSAPTSAGAHQASYPIRAGNVANYQSERLNIAEELRLFTPQRKSEITHKFLPLPGIERRFFGYEARSPVPTATELFCRQLRKCTLKHTIKSSKQDKAAQGSSWMSEQTAQLFADNKSHHEGINSNFTIVLLLLVAVWRACTVRVNR